MMLWDVWAGKGMMMEGVGRERMGAAGQEPPQQSARLSVLRDAAGGGSALSDEEWHMPLGDFCSWVLVEDIVVVLGRGPCQWR